MKKKQTIITIAALWIMHVSGAIGLQTEYAEWFISLTPLTLIVSFLLLRWNHEKRQKGFDVVLVGIGILGFAVEVLGVKTGFPFGFYQYGETLGLKFLDVPWIIGVNWMLLIYAFNMLTSGWKMHVVLRAGIAAAGMTILDVLIEPVAIHYGWWNWFGSEPPLLNYVGWFVVALLFSLVIQPFLKHSTNKSSVWLLVVLTLFFGFLNFMIG